MRQIFIYVIIVYQKFFSPLLKNVIGVREVCRYSPTCSEYAKRAFFKYGVIKGIYVSMLRLLSCQPIRFMANNNVIF